jgi:threonylcarbamoyladenosine tRNA methylthiotransferase MtaB
LASFRILTFGCKVNQCDSQIIRETLTSWGLTEAGDGESDVTVINTCTVTSAADSKFRKALRRIKRENPGSQALVTGCFADKAALFPEDTQGMDLVFKMRDFFALADFLRGRGLVGAEADLPAGRQTYFAEHTRAFLKIQDGCDRFCAYCVVPLVRPKLWSEELETVVAAINDLSRKGYAEVVLTGIHLGFYGRDRGRNALLDLMLKIEAECAIDRVRLSSTEINEVSDEMLELIAGSEKFCRHLHLPLQSGDDEMLREMGRGYSSATFAGRIEEIRGKIPDVGVTTDIIAGFPGETDEQFDHTMELIENVGFAKVHVFRFSPRRGTRAAAMRPAVSSDVAGSRVRRLIKFGEETAARFRERFVGQTLNVLAETGGENGNSCAGFSSNYIRVRVSDAPAGCAGAILPVRITDAGAGAGVAIGQMARGSKARR